MLLRPLGLLLPGPPPLGDQGDWQAAGDCDGDGHILLFLDLGGWGDGAAVGAGGQAQGGHRQLGRGPHAVGPGRQVGKEGAPKALVPALPPIAADGCLELVGVAEATLLTLLGVQVLHIPVGRDKRQDGTQDTLGVCLKPSPTSLPGCPRVL